MKMILKILKKFCKIRSLKLYISTRIKPDDKESLDKYKNIIGAGDWEIVPRKHKNSSLERICKSEFIVFVSSSLGYAALSRGKKFYPLLLDGTKINGDLNMAFTQ